MDTLADNPPSMQPRIVVPAGRLEAPIDNNNHRIVTHDWDINSVTRRVEMIAQARPGDCVLANFLNTESLEHAIRNNTDSQLIMTVQEAREAAIKQRERAGQNADDIRDRDQALEPKDVVNLFSSIHGVQPQQEDILTIEGRNKSQNQLRDDALSVLDYLDTYDSGLCSCGLGNHSFSIRKLEGDKYAIIDPLNPRGLDFTDTTHLMEYLTQYMAGRSADDNFFFFVRK